MYCKNCGNEILDDEKFCRNCGCNLVMEAAGAELSGKKPSGIKTVAGVVSLIAVVACVTAVILNVFLGRMNQNNSETADNRNNEYENNVEEDSTNPDTTKAQVTEADTGYSQEDYDNAVIMANTFSGEWYVKKYYDGKSWNTYELGKKMLIAAFNFLNDGSYTTGGYKYLSNYERIGTLNRYTYTYVPVEVHTYHGKDIQYSCPTIIISGDSIDMTGMDGPVFDISDFRYESIGGQDFLINDSCNFALMYDGTYIEYCEPDAYGYYQGYYAFDPFDSLVNITVTH